MRSTRCPFALSLALAVLAAGPAQAQGTAWVSSEKDHALTLVDLKAQAVTGTVPTCKRPRHLQFTPDGKQLAVACGESAQADFIDLATRKSVGVRWGWATTPRSSTSVPTAGRCTCRTKKTRCWASSSWPAASAAAR